MDEDLERAEARIGRVLNEKWTLEDLLGIGGMAAVYRARHRNGARVALKLLHTDLSRNEEIKRRFLHEGKAANRVDHPGAVSVIDDDVVRGGEDAGAAYLVMELLEGESVSSRMHTFGGKLPEGEVLAIAKGLLDVLEAAHAKGIIHRDLKPDNLFLVRDPDPDARPQFPWSRVKVLDFGIARAREEGDSNRTRTGVALGTPAYMAPEQALGNQDQIDGRTDLYAVGATMFRLLAGRKVHESSNSNEAMIKVATQKSPPLRSIAPHVSPIVAEIVDRAVRFDRDERYPSAAAMRDDVRAAMAGASLPSSAPASMRGVGAPFLAAVVADPTFGGAQRSVAAASMHGSETPLASALPPPPSPPGVIVRNAPVLAPTRIASTKKPPIALFAGLGAVLLLAAVVSVTYVCAPHREEPADDEKRKPRPKPAEDEHDEPEPKIEEPAESSAKAPPKKPVFESDGKGGWKKKN